MKIYVERPSSVPDCDSHFNVNFSSPTSGLRLHTPAELYLVARPGSAGGNDPTTLPVHLCPTCHCQGGGLQSLSLYWLSSLYTHPSAPHRQKCFHCFFICFQALIYYCEALTQPNLQLQKAACLALRYLKVREKEFSCGTRLYFKEWTSVRYK